MTATILARAARSVDRARTRFEIAERQLAIVCDLVIRSNQRIRRRRRIAGGSGVDVLTERIRAALAARTLPCIAGQVWAGKAPGTHRCACCGELIARDVVEFEPRDQPGLHAHLRCFGIWRAESERERVADRRQTAAG